MNLNNINTKHALVLIIILSMSASMLLIPFASSANSTKQITTFAYIQGVPSPIGVGQTATIYMWVDKIANGASMQNNIRFHNYELTITAPDGTVTTQTFETISDTTSNKMYTFTPTQVGTYNLTFNFPQQTLSDATTDYLYLASSATGSLVVQETPLSGIAETPLPTEYWTRPIYGTNSNWYTISSNWLGNGAPGYGGFSSSYNSGGNGAQNFAGDSVGPQTGHIMWTKSIQDGGIVGGNKTAIAGASYFEGSAYNQRYTNPIIVDGRLYYTEPLSFAGATSGDTVCVDLQTGEEIWRSADVPALSFAYIYDVQDANQHGTYPPILIATSGGGLYGGGSTTWSGYDAWTGEHMFDVTNIPSGTSILGPNGEHLILSLVNLGTTEKPNYYLQEWNSSKLWEPDYSGDSTSPPIVPVTTDGSWTGGYRSINTGFGVNNVYVPSLYDFNVSIPYLNNPGTGSVTIVGAIDQDVILCYNGSLPSSGNGMFFGTESHAPYSYFALSLDRDNVGNVNWHTTLDAPSGNQTVLQAGIDTQNRVFVEQYRETAQYVGYSLDTGAKLWGPTSGEVALDYYGSPASGSLTDSIAYGKIYSSGYGGIVYCYDTQNGNLLWTYGNGGSGNDTCSGYEVPGNYPTFVNAIGNDVVYLVTTEHTIETPIYKGALTRAINATTGEEIWTVSSYVGEFTYNSFAIADGYATWFNGYDNKVYVVGRGPSATTTEAQTFGSQIVIRGTVTDIASGTTQTEQSSRFPNGVPVASDASMKDWMGYVYQQQAYPSNFTGVQVTINVLDSNGNYRTIGTATTDASGMYTLTWKPDISGNYKVYAVFAGTNGYYGSSSETSFSVDEPTVTPTSSPTQQSAADLYFLPATAGLFVAIIVVIALMIVLLLRKHP